MIKIENIGDVVKLEDLENNDYIKFMILNKDLVVKANSKSSFDTMVGVRCKGVGNLFINQETDDIYPNIIIETDRMGSSDKDKSIILTITNLANKDITLPKGFEICRLYQMVPMNKDTSSFRNIYEDDKFALYTKTSTISVKKTLLEYNEQTQEKRLIIEM